jgi:hypothetical protein
VGRKRREDRIDVRSEVVPVRLTTYEREALGELVLARQRQSSQATESSVVRDLILGELRTHGLLRLPTREAPPGVDPLLHEAELAFGERSAAQAASRAVKRLKKKRRAT